MQQSNIYQQFQQKKKLLLLMIGFKTSYEMFGNVWDWAGKPRQIELQLE